MIDSLNLPCLAWSVWFPPPQVCFFPISVNGTTISLLSLKPQIDSRSTPTFSHVHICKVCLLYLQNVSHFFTSPSPSSSPFLLPESWSNLFFCCLHSSIIHSPQRNHHGHLKNINQVIGISCVPTLLQWPPFVHTFGSPYPWVPHLEHSPQLVESADVEPSDMEGQLWELEHSQIFVSAVGLGRSPLWTPRDRYILKS